MILTVEKYNFFEREAKNHLSNRFLEAFQPVTFNEIGFPTRIDKEEEVLRFFDTMHDGRLQWYYKDFDYAPTHEEFKIIKILAKNIYDLSKKRYGRGIIVKAPMLCSMNVCRRLNCLQRGGVKPAIFEIGGGNGLLGAMLHNAGYSYISTDITQAFYLTQSYLWEGLFPGCVDECIDSVDDLGRVGAQKMLHIPYWKLWELRNSNLEADIMVSNHALAEMHPRSLRFYLQYGKKLMRNSDYKLFVAQCPGGLIKGNIEYLFDTFNTMGYALLYSENDFIVFSLKDKQGILPADIRGLIKKLSLTPNTYDFPQYQNVLDETASGFYSAEQKIKNETKVSLQELMDFFYSLDGNVDSPDEEFVHYCQYDCI